MNTKLDLISYKYYNPFPETWRQEERVKVITYILHVFQSVKITCSELEGFEEELTSLSISDTLENLLKNLKITPQNSRVSRIKNRLLNKNNLYSTEMRKGFFPEEINAIRLDAFFFAYNYLLSTNIDTYKVSDALQELQDQMGLKYEDHYNTSSRYRFFYLEESDEESLSPDDFISGLSRLVKKFNLREHINYPFTQAILKRFYEDLKPNQTLPDTFFRFLNYTQLPVSSASTLNIPKSRRILIYRIAAGSLEGLSLSAHVFNREHKRIISSLRLKLSFSYEVIHSFEERGQEFKDLSLIEMSFYLATVISFFKDYETSGLQEDQKGQAELRAFFEIFEDKLEKTTKQSCMETSFFILFEFCIEGYRESECWSVKRVIGILSHLYGTIKKHDVILRGVSTIILFSSLINSKYMFNEEVISELKQILDPSIFELEGIKNASNIKEHRVDLIKVLFEYDFRNFILKNSPSSNQIDFLELLSIEVDNKVTMTEKELSSSEAYWSLYLCSLNKYLNNDKIGSDFDKVFLSDKELMEYGLEDVIYNDSFARIKRHVEIDLNSKVMVADKIDYRKFKKIS